MSNETETAKAKHRTPKHRKPGQVIVRGNTRLVRVYLGRDASGKRLYLNRTVKGNAEAADKVLKDLLETVSGIAPSVRPSRMTVNELIDKYVEEYAKENCRERTVAYYEWMLDSYVKPKLGNKVAGLLCHTDLNVNYSRLRKEKSLGPCAIRTTNAILSGVFNWGIKNKLVSANPCAYTTLPPLPPKKRRKLSEEQIAAFMEAAQTDKWFVLFALAIEQGLRPEEYLGLTWPDVNLTTGELHVQRTLVWRKKGAWYFSVPKSEQGNRILIVSEELRLMLAEHRRKQLEQRLKAKEYTDNGLVFAMSDGRPVLHRTLDRRHYKPILERAKLPLTTRLYDLRHTSASWQIANGTDPRTVSERLGHADVSFTLQNYVESDAKQQQQASQKFAKVLYR